MALILYPRVDGKVGEVEFVRDVTLGAGLWEDDQHAVPPAVGPHHAMITRSIFQFPVLVDRANAGVPTLVNGLPVALLRILRHADRIRFGGVEVVYWEVALRRATLEDETRLCSFCTDPIKAGVQVVVCPRCRIVQHRRCWFSLTHCAYHACEYPVQDVIRRVLAGEARIEQLEAGSALVHDKKRCPARRERDEVPFQADDVVVFCPECRQAFHTACWFARKRCATPNCRYDIADLMARSFIPGTVGAMAPRLLP